MIHHACGLFRRCEPFLSRQALTIRALVVLMVQPPLLALLMPFSSQPLLLLPHHISTGIAAVRVAPVARTTDRKLHLAARGPAREHVHFQHRQRSSTQSVFWTPGRIGAMLALSCVCIAAVRLQQTSSGLEADTSSPDLSRRTTEIVPRLLRFVTFSPGQWWIPSRRRRSSAADYPRWITSPPQGGSR
jgi:hypothetical protein